MIGLGIFLVIATAVVLGAGIGGSTVGVMMLGGLAVFGAVVIFRGWRMWRERDNLEGASNWAVGGFVVGGLLFSAGMGGIAYVVIDDLYGPKPTTAKVALSAFSTAGGTTTVRIDVTNTGNADLTAVTLRVRLSRCEIDGVFCEEVMNRYVELPVPKLAPGRARNGSFKIGNVSDVVSTTHEGRWSWYLAGVNGHETTGPTWTRPADAP